jgi:uncharacterized protein YggU (UPF0235/DUF167 family)
VIIEVVVKPSHSVSKVLFSDGMYTLYLKSKPHNNKANIELIDLLSSYFNIPKTSVKILKGLKSKRKLIEIA